MKLSSLTIAVISTSFTVCDGHLRGNPRHIQKELFGAGSQPPFVAVAANDTNEGYHHRRLQEMASLEEGKDSSDDDFHPGNGSCHRGRSRVSQKQGKFLCRYHNVDLHPNK